MNARLTRLTCIGATLVALAQPAAAQTARDSVLGTLDRLLVGMHTGDSALMAGTLAPDTRFLALDRLAPPDSLVKPATVQGFIARMRGYKEPINERILEPDVHIEDDVADVRAYYDVKFGERFSHCGVNLYQLARMHGEWRIVGMIWSRRRERCRAS